MFIDRKRYKKLRLFLFEVTTLYYDKYGHVVQTLVLSNIYNHYLLVQRCGLVGGIANQEWSEDFTIQQKQSSLQQR